jgi:hypothetical protein
MVSEQTLRDTLGDAGWDIASLDSETVELPPEGTAATFWLLRAERC